MSLLGFLIVAVQGWWHCRGRVGGLGLVFLGLSIWLIISSSLAVNRGEAFLQLVHFLPFFFFFLGVQVVLQKHSEILPTLLQDLVFGSFPLSLLAISEWVLKNANLHWGWPNYGDWGGIGATLSLYQDRVALWFGHPNFLACYLVVTIGLGLGLAWQSAIKPLPYPTPVGIFRIHPAMIYLGLGLNVCALISTASRTGWGVLFLQLVCLGIIWQRRFLGLILLFAVAGLVAVIGGLGNVAGRPEITQDPRFRLWPLGWQLMQERPVWGWGLGNFKEIYPPLAISPNYPDLAHLHNYWLTLAVESGIPFALGFSGLIFGLVWPSLAAGSWEAGNHNRGWQLGIGLGFLGTVAYGLLDVTYYQVVINALGWLLLAGLTVMANAAYPKQSNSTTA